MRPPTRPEVTTRTVAARPIATLAATTTWKEFPQVWGPLLDEVHASVTWDDGGRAGRNVMVYWDDVPHVEVGVELDRPATVTGRVVRSSLPAGRVATAVHRGTYEDIDATHRAILRWCEAVGLAPRGPRWEIYGHWQEDVSLLETEISYLLG
ncbi:GyrI-like domain-containing protein [Hamadaea tsunoensis]|uniref:GyrI-like domain-containing protein n=1 Tax=Hamadaea tsunoensis TaxID=53368 RepID=UPI000684EF3F|nr:GyrI-like domain-containing protein [Hamadaea tsunoensis]